MDNFIENLKKEQLKIARQINVPKFHYGLSFFRFIVGIDLAFLNEALVCFAIIDNEKKLISYAWGKDKVDFPYVPTFLAFRELPVINKLLNEIKLPFNTLFFIDGHGMSHPRKAGIATHFGVSNNLISIGIAKKLLYGRIKKTNKYPLVVDNEDNPIGIVIKTELLKRNKVMNSKHLFLSVGNNINLENSLNLFLKIKEKYGVIPTELAHNFLQKIKNSQKLSKNRLF